MYAHLLVPTDGTELSNKAVKEAARLAKMAGSRLLILHVRSPIDMPHHVEGGALTRMPNESVMAEIESEERTQLDAAIKIADAEGVQAETAFTAGYAPSESIIRIAAEQQCDAIVMASHGRSSLAALVLGSETHKVLTQTKIPVLVVR